jgi:hypothetical protein
MKFFCIPLLALFFITPITASAQSVEELLSQIQKDIEQKDFSSYLNAFSPRIRDFEKDAVTSYFDALKMDRVSIFQVNKVNETENEASAFLQVLFENSYSALFETWQLWLGKVDNHWEIKKKGITGTVSNLYKIKIPGERVERVESIDIEHVDIKLSFKDALCFYDNIPNLQTALLIIGKGHLHFSPSDPAEQHQLELIYENPFLEDNLEYAFIRCSNIFFENNIKIKGGSDKNVSPLSPAVKNRAYSLFLKNYSRSFTIQNSLNGELLSFLPQGDEAVFDFQGKKAGELSYIYSPFAEEEVNLYDFTKDRIINLYTPHKEEQKKRLFVSFGEKFNVRSYTIDLDFNPRQSYLSVKAKVDIVSQVEYLDGVKFKMNPELDILRIVDEEGRRLFYTQDKLRKILYIYFIIPPPRGKTASIEVFYRGELEPPVQTVDVLPASQIRDTIVLIAPRYETYLFSQSAYWYPAPPDENYFQARIRIIIPPDYKCVSNGELIESGKLSDMERVEDLEKVGNSFYIFETKNPIKYISFIVGKFSKEQESPSPIALQFFITPDVWGQRKTRLEETGEIIRFYESRFGPFPFEKLGIVQRVWPSSGGHSPASFIVLNELPRRGDRMIYVNVDSPVDLSRWGEYFLAHEISHQWWGQGVTWGTYHDQWLSEGLAEFSSVLYLRKKHGDGILSSIFKKFSQWTERKAKWGPILLGSRLCTLDFDAYQAIVYGKTSLVLNMLLDLLGENAFFNGLKDFFAAHKYGSARTRDFKRAMEKISGKDLEAFFKAWFSSHSLPDVKVSHSVEPEAEGYLLKVIINQPQEVFMFPLWIEWKENGKTVREKVVVEGNHEVFSFRLKGKPGKVTVNPDRAVPGKFY